MLAERLSHTVHAPRNPNTIGTYPPTSRNIGKNATFAVFIWNVKIPPLKCRDSKKKACFVRYAKYVDRSDRVWMYYVRRVGAVGIRVDLDTVGNDVVSKSRIPLTENSLYDMWREEQTIADFVMGGEPITPHLMRKFSEIYGSGDVSVIEKDSERRRSFTTSPLNTYGK